MKNFGRGAEKPYNELCDLFNNETDNEAKMDKYSDLHPVSSIGMRLAAGSEAFFGAFLLSYFVVVVSPQNQGRV